MGEARTRPDPEADHRGALRADLEALRMPRDDAPARRRGRRRRWPWGVAAALAVVAVAGWLAFGAAPRVEVALARSSPAAAREPLPLLSGAGYLVPGNKVVAVGARVPGRIAAFLVDEGDAVAEDDPLVRLDDREYAAVVDRTRAQVAAAEARSELARLELARGRELFARDSLSRQELDVRENELALARAAAAEARAALRQAELDLEYTVLRAPSEAVVLAKLKEVGEIAVPGGFAGSGDVVRLANMSEVRAEVDVNEADLPLVRLGQEARVSPDAVPDADYAARVVKLHPQVDRQKGTLKVEVRLDQPDARLLPDMSARVVFLGAPPGEGTGTAVLVPSGAVQRATDGRSYVWVVEDGRARQAFVETAGLYRDDVRVVSGLEGGERLVVGEPPTRDGQRVRVEPAGEAAAPEADAPGDGAGADAADLSGTQAAR